MSLSKKQLALGLVLLFTLGLALTGCGGGGAKTEEFLKIGSIQDMSGTTSVFGNAITRGAELAIEKINAQGGVNGKKLKLITLDTKGDPKEAINAYNRLVDQEKVVAVLGPPISNIGLALAPIANTKKVPVVGSFIDPRVTVGADGKPQAAGVTSGVAVPSDAPVKATAALPDGFAVSAVSQSMSSSRRFR